jgi:hypothetical protein
MKSNKKIKNENEKRLATKIKFKSASMYGGTKLEF